MVPELNDGLGVFWKEGEEVFEATRLRRVRGQVRDKQVDRYRLCIARRFNWRRSCRRREMQLTGRPLEDLEPSKSWCARLNA